MPLARSHRANDLLCEHIQASPRDLDCIHLALDHGPANGRSLHKLVALEDQYPPPAGGIKQVTGTSDSLKPGRHGLG